MTPSRSLPPAAAPLLALLLRLLFRAHGIRSTEILQVHVQLVGVKQFVAVLAPDLGWHDVLPVVRLDGGVGGDDEVIVVEVELMRAPLGAMVD